MTSVHGAGSEVVLFADLDADLWGAAFGGTSAAIVVADLTGAGPELEAAQLDTSDEEVWTITAAGCALRIERADTAASSPLAELAAPLQACRVSGSVTPAAGVEREVDLGGIRCPALTADGVEALRLFGAWFPGGHELAVLASRPRGAKGQDRDRVGVVARGEEHELIVDPRLSTTYGPQGEPRRVGLELWLADDEDGDQWPRRVAGAATGSQVQRDGLSAFALRCVSRGTAGAGVYLLAR